MTDMLHTFTIACLDLNTNPHEGKRRQLLAKCFKLFRTVADCRQYMEENKSENIILVTVDSLGKIILPTIHDLPQLTAVYIQCADKEKTEDWTRCYTKIKNVDTDSSSLLQQLYLDEIKSKNTLQNSFRGIDLQDQKSTFSIYNRSEASSTKLNGNFLWFQLFIEILLKLSFTISTAKKELIDLFKNTYDNDEIEQRKIREFDNDYVSDKAINWYTKDFCLYRLLNKALRKQDIDLLYTFRFYIADVHQQLQREYKHLKASSTTSVLHVYRSQAISSIELQRIRQSQNEFISMNSFLSTSKSKEQALSFILGAESTDDLAYVLFEMYIDLKLNSSKPFADITMLSAIEGEEEVLFMLGSIFRIQNVTQDVNNNLWIVSLELCSQDDTELNSIFKYFTNNFGEKTSLWHLTDLLFDMYELDKSEKFYKRLIPEVSECEAAICYDALGVIENERANYNLALAYHNQSLNYLIKIVDDNHPLLGYTYDHLGTAYRNLDDYDQALKNHLLACEIWLMVYGDNHTEIARSLINIGLIHDKKQDFDNALSHYFYALKIYEENHLPNDHPLFGLLFNNIGYIYFQQDDYIEALNYYNKSLEVRLKCLPSLHTDIGVTYHNMGALHFNHKSYLQALDCFLNAKEIYEHSYENTHPRILNLRDDIQKCQFLIVS
ncbi:unnamed protein product [Adineta ricciae]|uniref:NAD(P)(+)--arginine ADP-ribosyltransferase n=1 Tax=Adineta ricciae TaxID=249248 RepID=A0A813TNQ7_ADIRI|nr:unnamed protein product [Adineta ricciae]